MHERNMGGNMTRLPKISLKINKGNPIQGKVKHLGGIWPLAEKINYEESRSRTPTMVGTINILDDFLRERDITVNLKKSVTK